MWFVVLILTLTILYYVLRRQYSYWSKQKVPGPDPIPFFGNMGKSFVGVKSIGDIISDIYRKYENYPFVGIYRGFTPCILVRDLDFIKNISVKDFKSFHDNEFSIDKDVEPLFGRNPFVLKGEEWKKSRSQLTQCFTSGKMKSIFPLVSDIGKQLVEYVENQNMPTNSAGMEAKDLCAKFTLNNVAACAFGIDGNCFKDPNSHITNLARTFISPDSWASFKMVLLMLAPKFAKFISLKVVPKQVDEELIRIVRNTTKHREENNIVRNDFLDYVNQLVKSSDSFKEIDAVAHAASFFADGYETSSGVMSFFLFELASNPEIQSKLREEITDCLENNNNEFSYESIQEMIYLDACLNESLRKTSVFQFIPKICTERYTYTPSNPAYDKITVTVEPGTPVIVSIEGIHKDPKYFQSPEEYIPERFLDKDNVHRYPFMPFGEGPRACLGQRFGILQVKIGVAYLVKNFDITVNSRTKLPLTYDPWNIMLSPKGGLWLNFHKI